MADVSLAARREFFGDRFTAVAAYAELLAREGELRGLIGPRENERLWSRHIVNCAGLADLVPAGARVIDVGSGAGLPGMVLALMRPDIRMHLLEPMQRRVDWLEYVRDECDVANVSIERASAVECSDTFTVVTSRAVAPLAKLVRWCAHLVAPGGMLTAIKGRSAESEFAAARKVLAASALGEPRCVMVPTIGDEPPTTVVVIDRPPAAG